MYVDMDGALQRMRGNKKLYARMLELFLQGTEVQAFEEHYAAGDMEAAGRDVHAIKGVTGNLSLTPLFDASVELLGLLRAGETPSPEKAAEFRVIYDATRNETEAVIAQLKQG